MNPAIQKSTERDPGQRLPKVLIVGGLARLEAHYRDSEPGAEIEVSNKDCSRLDRQLARATAVIVVMPAVSHGAVAKVRRSARQRGFRVVNAASPGVGEVGRLVRGVVAEAGPAIR